MLKQEVRFCTAQDGTRIAYGITGAGPPLVFPATWQTHLGLDTSLLGYRHWLEGLSSRNTLIRGDLRGSGLSDWDTPSMEFEDWVSDLEAMVDDAGLDRFPIFGLSHGCATAIAYTARHPERVSHLVLYAASARATVPARTERGRRRWDAYRNFLREFWDSEDPQIQRFLTSNVVRAAGTEIVMALDRVRRSSMSPVNALRALDTVASTDVVELLPQIKAPALILHPRRGSTVTEAMARGVAAAIPDARLVALECDNHLIQEYEPGWPALLRATWEFVGVGPEIPGHAEPGHQESSSCQLTKRESEVLALIAQHRTNAEIADRLVISSKTASKHVHNILAKLGVRRRSEAAEWWHASGRGQLDE